MTSSRQEIALHWATDETIKMLLCLQKGLISKMTCHPHVEMWGGGGVLWINETSVVSAFVMFLGVYC